ncbi:MAG: hypothetical protein ACRBB0_01010 [Pelagimonas sp.]
MAARVLEQACFDTPAVDRDGFIDSNEARLRWEQSFSNETWIAMASLDEDPQRGLLAWVVLLTGAVLGAEAARGLDWIWVENRAFLVARQRALGRRQCRRLRG